VALDLIFPLLSGSDSRHVALKNQAQLCAKTSEPVLLLGELSQACDIWAQACSAFALQHYSLKPHEGLLGESHLWSSLRALMESNAAVLYLTGFSQLDPILKASLLDWLQTQGSTKKIILQSDDMPVAALRELSFYKRCRVLSLVPLKERLSDVPEICEALLQLYNRSFVKEIESLDPILQQWLSQYTWPGDLMELDGVMRDLVLGSEGTIVAVAQMKFVASQLLGNPAQREEQLVKILGQSVGLSALERFLDCKEGSLRRKLS
jgi:transcriptional regulator of aromatic amino acid metabolism